jgi:integrase
MDTQSTSMADTAAPTPRKKPKKLTPIAVENLKPDPIKRREVSDGSTGLYRVVQPSGAVAWAVRYRFNGRQQKLTLNGSLTLAAARKEASNALHEVEQGRDPSEQRKAAKRKAAAAKADTIDHLWQLFLERHAKKKNRTWRHANYLFEKEVEPKWGGKVVHDIKRRDVIDLVEAISERAPILANRVLGALTTFFNFLASRDIIALSPCHGVRRPSKETPRDRALDDDEIVALWKASDAAGSQYASIVRLLLLTGERWSEVTGMRSSELDQKARTWTLPPERTKNKRQHIVPLPPQAWAIIEAMPRIGDSDLVFTNNGQRPLGGRNRAKEKIDAEMKPATPWVFHDLRRSAATGMQRIGVQMHVIEKALNHVSGSFGGIVSVYQTHSYAAEVRVALEKWANHIDHLVTSKPAALLHFPQRQG